MRNTFLGCFDLNFEKSQLLGKSRALLLDLAQWRLALYLDDIGKARSQDVGGPCCNKPQAVCFRLLAELTIENPPISSTFTFRGTEAAGMEGEGARASPLLLLLLLPPSLLQLSSPCFSLWLLAWVERGSSVLTARRLG